MSTGTGAEGEPSVAGTVPVDRGEPDVDERRETDAIRTLDSHSFAGEAQVADVVVTPRGSPMIAK
jgi:hypothetical protein